MTRVAGIDCGTNSIRLLVADIDLERGVLTDLDRRMEVVRLGQGVDRTGRIAPEALERTLDAARRYAAICADLGSRRIREEIDAMEVMGLSVMERLVVPRMFAIVVVAVLLNGVVMFFTILTTLSISVVIQDLPPGSYLASVTTLAQLSDLWLSLAKAAIFAVICAIVASYKGLGASRGPTGVGEAVTSAVVAMHSSSMPAMSG